MIKTEIKNKIGIIYLDRPEALNALNRYMIGKIEETLKSWEKDPEIKAILFDSKNERGFCAGGDLKEIYVDYLKNDEAKDKDVFFKEEFALDKYLMTYPKPIISHWFGVTMGGGIGLTIHSDLIIADQTVNWAMPETSLGFVPDVGLGYFISKLPQSMGQYVGLLGARLYPDDLLRYGFCHMVIDSKDYDELINRLMNMDTDSDNLIEDFKEKILDLSQFAKETENTKNLEEIEKHFSKDRVVEIKKSLEASDSDFAKESLGVLNNRDPFMLEVQFKKYFLGKKLTKQETIDLDLDIIKYGRKTGALEEGIRSVLIDKDKNPNWPTKRLEDVDCDEVDRLLGIK
ncbi:enoyl-CoA hydratase/isomerase family protein [uncultured Anaerococcus sp.]|uniref:enoyl-CoA hydratase/isomerase family protein n=1 Tax=uncultured Anaerococcus sp. TaxID=293428 RepID=UPI00280B9992|nr:enoyl-CoA hydratase/isomerase family protein [uncultured Anaerococcus sp.]